MTYVLSELFWVLGGQELGKFSTEIFPAKINLKCKGYLHITTPSSKNITGITFFIDISKKHKI